MIKMTDPHTSEHELLCGEQPRRQQAQPWDPTSVAIVLVLLLVGLWATWLVRAEVATIVHGPDILMVGYVLLFLLFVLMAAKTACAIAWWFYASRTVRNTRSLGTTGPDPKPVNEWWFVPIVNWVMPYLGIMELRKAIAEAAPSASGSTRGPILVIVWWVAWVVHQASVLVTVVMVFSDIDQVSMLIWWVVRDGALVVVATLGIAIISTINVERSSWDSGSSTTRNEQHH